MASYDPHSLSGHVTIADDTRGQLAIQRFLNRLGSPHLLTPGAQHIDCIMRDCVQRRLPVEQTTLRLLVAADLADVLDRRA